MDLKALQRPDPVSLVRQTSMLFFDRPGTINPSSSLQLAQVGECGMAYSLMGPGFYQVLESQGLAQFERLGVRYVYAAVSDAHLRLMRARLKAVVVEYQFKCRIADHALNWVLLRPATSDSPTRAGRMPESRKTNMNDQAIEQEIQAKGLTAPRVTPADIEATIKSEFYFTASEGVLGASEMGTKPAGRARSLDYLTFCVLVLANGFTVTGESACASPENFDADLGRKIARDNAKQKIWVLEGYALKTKLAG